MEPIIIWCGQISSDFSDPERTLLCKKEVSESCRRPIQEIFDAHIKRPASWVTVALQGNDAH
jgi:hypothetical protein